jgi:hypothetical protein
MNAVPNLPSVTPSTPPDWMLAFFQDIDEKHFEPPFGAFLTDDAQLRFGVHDVRGR